MSTGLSMTGSGAPRRIVRFAVFEFDLGTGELRKHGLRIKLRGQPVDVLTMLIEHPGAVVTREELQKRLWPADTYVDFEHSLNAAIKRLRAALGDSPDAPRFVETLARQGYRFIAPLSNPAETQRVQTQPVDGQLASVPQEIENQKPVLRRPEAPETTNDEGKRRSRLWLTVALAGLAVALAALGWWWVQHKSAPVTIAVLPLNNLSQDPANDYFTDGLTDELIRNLSIIDGLAVRSQTSSFAFKGKPQTVREAGKRLESDYILEGSVLLAGQRLRINIQLIRARDDFPLWTDKFDRDLTDIFTIQEEISRGIVNGLRLRLGRGRRRYETSVEAYDLYLRARALGTGSNIGPFEEAIAKDPSFAPAYAGLAAAYAYRSGTVDSDRADLAKMRAAAEKAIQLDPLLAEAHDALGIAYARDAQWVQSEKSFRHAIELDPGRSTSYEDFALYLLLVLARIDEALQQLRVAEKADPLSPQMHNSLANVLISAGRYDEAAGHCQKLPAGQPAKSQCLGRARLGQGRTAEAVEILAAAVDRGLPANATIPGYLGNAYARAGRREEAEKLAAAASTLPFQQALVFAGLGDKDRTMDAVERMAVFGPVRLGRDLTYPEFDLLRGDPRLKALRKKVGLPE
jgi:TolB-like protein/DNA-binding winged helix-turn-helix (wHTH) protein/Tfp pilus assembly protein PilF